jgi:hypothetical protein
MELVALDVAGFGVHVEWAQGTDRQRIADLVARADLEQMHDRSFRRELAAWTTPNRTIRRDGIRGDAHRVGDLASTLGPLAIRLFDLGQGAATRDVALARGCPALAVISTAGDERRDWSVTGAALMAMLLRLETCGYAASFLNQPIEVEALRDELARRFGASGVPQLLLRIGQPAQRFDHTARRWPDDVIIHGPIIEPAQR